jgi:type IV pilus assembly protein PilW
MVIVQRQNGFSLIEIMVSLVLGLLVLAMVLNVFINTKQSHVQNDRISGVLENGRFAVRQLATDLKTVGYLGGMYDSTLLKIDGSLSISSANDCGTSSETNWALDVTSYKHIQFLNQATASEASTQHKCISSTDIQPDTDVLVVKRAYTIDETNNASKTDDSVYLRTDYSTGCLWWYNSSGSTAPSGGNCPASGFKDWRYMTHVYYIRKTNDAGEAIPTLCRKTLAAVSGAPGMKDVCLSEGIEKFHVQFGIDTSTPRDGVPDMYLSDPTTTEMQRVTSAKIYVLARADKEDPVFTNNKTYTLGNYTINANDNYYRRVYSTTVLLRNPANTAIFTSY